MVRPLGQVLQTLDGHGFHISLDDSAKTAHRTNRFPVLGIIRALYALPAALETAGGFELLTVWGQHIPQANQSQHLGPFRPDTRHPAEFPVHKKRTWRVELRAAADLAPYAPGGPETAGAHLIGSKIGANQRSARTRSLRGL
jgi:hypothetical protein